MILRVLTRPLWSLPSRFGKSGCSASLLAPNPSAVCPAGSPSLLGHTRCSHQPLPRDTPRSATAGPSPASLPPTAALRSLRPRQVPSQCQCRENSLPAFSALSFRSPVLGCRMPGLRGRGRLFFSLAGASTSPAGKRPCPHLSDILLIFFSPFSDIRPLRARSHSLAVPCSQHLVRSGHRASPAPPRVAIVLISKPLFPMFLSASPEDLLSISSLFFISKVFLADYWPSMSVP